MPLKNHLQFYLVVSFMASVTFADISDDFDEAPKLEPTPIPTASISPKNKLEVKKDPESKAEVKPSSSPSPKKSGVPNTAKDNAPVKYRSEGLKGKKNDGYLELMKNVEVVQGDMKIQADFAEVYFDKTTNKIDRVYAKGRVHFWKTDPETQQLIKGNSNEAFFYNEKREVLLKGNAKIYRGPDLMTGNQFTYGLDTGWITADKVEGVVKPKPNAKK